MQRRFIATFVAVACLVGGWLLTGEVLSHPALRALGRPPADIQATAVRIPSNAGSAVAGWLVRGRPGAGAILLLHGVRGNRQEMLGRARFLNRLGYSLLLIDLPAHGESPGDHITYGYAEARGVASALRYLSGEFPAEKIGVIGVSLGAASLVLAKSDVPLSAVVLESMFPTFREAVADRIDIYVGPWAESLAPLLLWQLPVRLGISEDQLRPIVELPSMHVPLLIAAGSVDRHTPLAETRRLFAAANPPKELWIVDGAAHVDLHAFAPGAYEDKVAAFLDRYLRSGG